MKIEFTEEMKQLTLSNDEVISYRENLSTAEKHAIILAALQKSFIEGDYRAIIYNAIVRAQAIMYYTDVKIENIDEVNILDIYDYFKAIGLCEQLESVCRDYATFCYQDADMAFVDAQESLRSAGQIISKLGADMMASIGTLLGVLGVAADMDDEEAEILEEEVSQE